MHSKTSDLWTAKISPTGHAPRLRQLHCSEQLASWTSFLISADISTRDLELCAGDHLIFISHSKRSDVIGARTRTSLRYRTNFVLSLSDSGKFSRILAHVSGKMDQLSASVCKNLCKSGDLLLAL